MESILRAIPTDSTYNLPLAPVWLAVVLIVVALAFLVLAVMIGYTFIEGGPGGAGGSMFFLGLAFTLGVLGYVSFHEHLMPPPAPEVAQSQEAT